MRDAERSPALAAEAIDAALGGERRTDDEKRLARAGAWLIGLGIRRVIGGDGQ